MSEIEELDRIRRALEALDDENRKLLERIADLQRQVEAERSARTWSAGAAREIAHLTRADIALEESERDTLMRQALARARKLAKSRLKLARSRLKRTKKAEEDRKSHFEAFLEALNRAERLERELESLRAQIAEGS